LLVSLFHIQGNSTLISRSSSRMTSLSYFNICFLIHQNVTTLSCTFLAPSLELGTPLFQESYVLSKNDIWKSRSGTGCVQSPLWQKGISAHIHMHSSICTHSSLLISPSAYISLMLVLSWEREIIEEVPPLGLGSCMFCFSWIFFCFWLVDVLVCWGCHSTGHRRWLKHQKFVFSVLEIGSPRPRCWQCWFLWVFSPWL
jgi:hypothetical protein